MDFWLWWLIGGVILLILETFVGTFDLLALGIAAMITALLSWLLGIDVTQWKLASFIFLLASVLAIGISRRLVLPKVKGVDGPEPMSADAVIGTSHIIQEVKGRKVVRYEGVYWNIESEHEVIAGDKVTVIAMRNNHLVVE